MIKFREHRSSLEDSMKTLVELHDWEQLVAHIRHLLEPWGVEVSDTNLTVERYFPDLRIEWPDSHIVHLKGYGVVGFTDGPVASLSSR